MTLSRLSLLVHTSNRPQFLKRMLDELVRQSGTDAPNVVILDGSDERRSIATQAMLDDGAFPLAITRYRFDRDLPLQHRFERALRDVSTPYVALAADDDFYRVPALREAVRSLDQNEDLGTIYGHMMVFTLDRYVPYAPFKGAYVHARSNPPLFWLEADDPAVRLQILSQAPDEPSAAGWYAVQRTDILRRTASIALEAKLGNYLLEYLQIFVQSALYKSKMIDELLQARQDNPAQAHAITMNADLVAQFAALETLCVDLLEGAGLDAEQAYLLTRRFYDGVRLFSDVQHAGLRRRKIIRRIPGLNMLRRALGRDRQAAKAGGGYLDPRLPKIPDIGGMKAVLEEIASACRAST